jgi:hypothetical protein
MADKLDLEPLDLEPLESSNKLDLEPLDLEPVEEEKSFLQSAKETGTGLLRGAEQGATLGFADELGTMIENYRLKKELERMGLDQDTLNTKAQSELAKQEKANLEGTRQEYRAAQEAAPIAYGTGQLGGAVATGMATAPLAGAGSLARLSALGATEGAVTGYGTSEAETLEGALPEIATGAAFGALAPGAAKALAPVGRMALAPVKAVGRTAKKVLSDLGEAEVFKDVKRGFEYGTKKGQTLFSEQPAREAGEQLEKTLGDTLGVVSGAKKTALETTEKAQQEILERTKAAEAEMLAASQKAQEKVAKDLAAAEAAEQANKKLVQEQKIAFEKGKQSTVSSLNKKVDQSARTLADKYANLYNSLGTSRKAVVAGLEQQGVKVDTLPFEEQLTKMFGNLTTDERGLTTFSNMRNINAIDTQKISSILDDVRKFQGEIPYSKVEELKDLLQKYAYGRGGLTDESKRSMKALYDSMNKSIDASLKAQGLEESAKRLNEINKGFRTLYKAQDIGLEKLAPDELISGTGYQKLARQVGSEDYTPQFGEQKERMLANIEELLASPAVSEEQKQALRQALEEAKSTSQKLVGAEAETFTPNIPEVQKPAPLDKNMFKVDEEAIRKEVLATPEVAAADKAMAQVKDVEQVFGDVLTRGTKEARLPSKALTTAEVAGTDQYAAKLKELESLRKAVTELDPEKAAQVLPELDKAIEEIGFLTRTGRSVPIGDLTTQATGGIRALAVKGASALGATKMAIKEEIKKATPDSLKNVAKFIRSSTQKAGEAGAKTGQQTREVFAQMLDKAADNPDKIARSATVFMLLQDPKYREIMDEENKE